MTLALIALTVVTAAGALIFVAYYAFRFNKHTCPVCSKPVRERHAMDHGGDPTVYTHHGDCATKHSHTHAETYYRE